MRNNTTHYITRRAINKKALPVVITTGRAKYLFY